VRALIEAGAFIAGMNVGSSRSWRCAAGGLIGAESSRAVSVEWVDAFSPDHPIPGRRLWLHAQKKLDHPNPFGNGPAATRRQSGTWGTVQIDTIHVIERCNHPTSDSHGFPTTARASDTRRIDGQDSFEYWTIALAYLTIRGFSLLPCATEALLGRAAPRAVTNVKVQRRSQVLKGSPSSARLTIRESRTTDCRKGAAGRAASLQTRLAVGIFQGL